MRNLMRDLRFLVAVNSISLLNCKQIKEEIWSKNLMAFVLSYFKITEKCEAKNSFILRNSEEQAKNLNIIFNSKIAAIWLKIQQ